MEILQDWRLFQKYFEKKNGSFPGKSHPHVENDLHNLSLLDPLFEMDSFLDQMDFLREKGGCSKGHFFLRGVRSWLSFFLPTHYSIFICLDGQLSQSILLTLHGKSIEGFFTPDFSGLYPCLDSFQDSSQTLSFSSVLQFIYQKNLIPIQGIFVSSRLWQEWSLSSAPWIELRKEWKKKPHSFPRKGGGVKFLFFFYALNELKNQLLQRVIKK